MNLIATVLIGIGAILSVCNWLCLLSSLIRRRAVSPVFPVPSLLTALGLALADSTRPYWLVGLLTDYTLFSLLAAIPGLMSEVWRFSPFTRQELLVAEEGPRHFTLSLHRDGYFVLRGRFQPGVPCDEHGSFVKSFGAPGRWEKTSDGHLRLWSYRGDRELVLRPLEADYVAREAHYPDNVRHPYDRLDGLRFHRHA